MAVCVCVSGLGFFCLFFPYPDMLLLHWYCVLDHCYSEKSHCCQSGAFHMLFQH